MKNQYFGDVNDYRKYGLLRAIMSVTSLPLGVCWLLTEPDGRTDGEFRRYLEEPKRWRQFDPTLYDNLRHLLDPSVGRNVRLAETWDLLPGAQYYTPILYDDVRSRTAYFSEAFHALAACPLLFFDPDNGFAVPSTRIGNKRSSKYLYWPEVSDAYRRGHSLVVYQHYPMHVKRVPFVEGLAAECLRRLGAPSVDTFGTPYVVFVVIPRPEHASRFAELHDRINTTWLGQIQPLTHVVREPGVP